jgi:hypothetical protein
MAIADLCRGAHVSHVIHILCPHRVFPSCLPVDESQMQIWLFLQPDANLLPSDAQAIQSIQ